MCNAFSATLAQLVALPLIVSIRYGNGTVKIRTNQMPVITYADPQNPRDSQCLTFSPVTSIANVPCEPTTITVPVDYVAGFKLDNMALWDMAQKEHKQQTADRLESDLDLDPLDLGDSGIDLGPEIEFPDDASESSLQLDLTDPQNRDSALVGGNPPATPPAVAEAVTELSDWTTDW